MGGSSVRNLYVLRQHKEPSRLNKLDDLAADLNVPCWNKPLSNESEFRSAAAYLQACVSRTPCTKCATPRPFVEAR
jgi:hypothetical protein